MYRSLLLAVLGSAVTLHAASAALAAESPASTGWVQAVSEPIIRGRVLDATGAVIVGATVAVLDADGQAGPVATTSANGSFVVERVAVGRRVLLVTAPGFATRRVTLTVDDGRATSVDVTLQPPGVTELVSVVGATVATMTTELTARLDRNQALQVKDVFAAEPSVSVGGGTRQGQRAYLRGVEGTNLNITIDGARQGQNLYNHRGGLADADPEMLKRVELQPGPSAADQGAAALGGSVRMETVDAQDLLRDGRRAGAFLRAGSASSNEALRGSMAAYAQPVAGLGLLAYVTGNRFEDQRIGGGDLVPYSGGDDVNYLLKLSLLNRRHNSVRISADRYETQGFNFMQRGDYPYQVQLPIAVRPPQDQTVIRTTLTGQYGYAPPQSLIDVEVKSYRNVNDFSAPNSAGERFLSVVWGGDVRNTFVFDSGAIRQRLTVGADYFRSDGLAQRTAAPDRTNFETNTGLFVQHRIAGARGLLTAGARVDDFESSFGTIRRLNGRVASPNVSGEWRVTPAVGLFAGYGRAVRGSSTIPIHFARNIVDDVVFRGGALEPERSTQTEAGMRLSRTVGGGSQRLGVDVAVFRTTIANAIGYLAPGTGGLGGRPIREIYNETEDFRSEGFDVRGTWRASAFETFLGVTRATLSGVQLLPQFSARQAAPMGDKLVWDSRFRPWSGVSLGYTLTAVADLTDAVGALPPRPGYTVHDLRAEWAPRAGRGLVVSAAALNLFDARYINQATLTELGFATEEPGRDLRVTIGYRF